MVFQQKHQTAMQSKQFVNVINAYTMKPPCSTRIAFFWSIYKLPIKLCDYESQHLSEASAVLFRFKIGLNRLLGHRHMKAVF